MNKLFEIFRVNNLVLKDLMKHPNQAHQHNYEEIIVVLKGAVEHFVNFETTRLDAPFISFVAKGKTHRIKPIDINAECDGFVIRFQSEFVSETIFQLYHFFYENANIVFSSNRELVRFVTLCELLHDEAQQKPVNYSIVQSLLNTILTILESLKTKSNVNHLVNNHLGQFVKFLQILEENYNRSVSVSFYAEQLQMSSRNLNIICQKILNKSINEIILTRKLIKAKKLLITTNKSISEIGFEIGYAEKSYFSNIFKKKTGKTPSAFRKEINSLLS